MQNFFECMYKHKQTKVKHADSDHKRSCEYYQCLSERSLLSKQRIAWEEGFSKYEAHNFTSKGYRLVISLVPLGIRVCDSNAWVQDFYEASY